MSKTVVTLAGSDRALRIEKSGGRFEVTGEDGSRLEIEVLSIAGGIAELQIGSQRAMVPYLLEGDRVDFAWSGETWRAVVVPKARPKRARHAEHSMSAPMPGQVLKIFVKVGDVVSKGDPLLVLEAMKMEHQIAAPYPGRVESIGCAVGDLVQPGVDLIAVAPEVAP